MTQKTLIESDLRQFTGTENWYRHPIAGKVLYTEGARHVAEAGGAYWLLDEIAVAQTIQAVAAESFQLWKLTVSDDQTALLQCEDGDSNLCFEKQIEFTDFPLSKIILYFADQVILLPSEY